MNTRPMPQLQSTQHPTKATRLHPPGSCGRMPPNNVQVPVAVQARGLVVRRPAGRQVQGREELPRLLVVVGPLSRLPRLEARGSGHGRQRQGAPRHLGQLTRMWPSSVGPAGTHVTFNSLDRADARPVRRKIMENPPHKHPAGQHDFSALQRASNKRDL